MDGLSVSCTAVLQHPASHSFYPENEDKKPSAGSFNPKTLVDTNNRRISDLREGGDKCDGIGLAASAVCVRYQHATPRPHFCTSTSHNYAQKTISQQFCSWVTDVADTSQKAARLLCVVELHSTPYLINASLTWNNFSWRKGVGRRPLARVSLDPQRQSNGSVHSGSTMSSSQRKRSSSTSISSHEKA